MKNLTILLAAAVFGLAACSKKDRDVRYAQGQGQNLITIGSYDGEKELIVTGEAYDDVGAEALRTQQRTEVQKSQVHINATELKIQSLPTVRYTTEKMPGSKLKQSLLDGKVPLKGRPQHKYEAHYRVTENYLKIYKVGKAEDIDKDEQTFAETLADGRLAVPMVGYPVRGFYKTERATNSDNEQTNIIVEIPTERDNATHMKIDFNAPEAFEAVQKAAVFKANFFDGDWYFSATVISAPEENKDAIGFGGAMDQNYNSSERVKFVKSEGLLKAVNVNIDERLDKTEDSNLSTAVAIPIQWKEYAQKTRGKDTALAEEEVNSKSWENRSYIDLDFDRTQSPIMNALAGDIKSLLNAGMGSKVVGIEMTDKYFSFTLQQHDSNIRVRFSFFRAEKRDYVAKRYFSDDKNTFGFFSTEKGSVRNYERRRQEDIDKNIFINRFNPKKDIVFHFTKNTPDWLRPAIRDSVNEWNKAFVAAGATSKVLLDESFDVDLGDLRYNAINLIESLSGSNLFGFGPSITDPYTGEIISATSNVHVTPIRTQIVEEIRNYIRHKTGELAGNYIPGAATMKTDILNTQVVENSVTGKTEVTYAGRERSLKVPMMNENGQIVEKNIEFKNRVKNFKNDSDLSMSSGNLHQSMEQMCKDDLLPYIEDLKRTKQVDSDRELEVLNSCSKKLAVSKVQGTFIHEMGHNLGLRHNFRASTDKSNFWPVEYTQKLTGNNHLVRSSSVMEYSAFNEDRLTMAGAYDIAAIRFGYADSVLLSDNQTVLKLDTNKTIKQNLSAKGASLRPYKYCTDEDAYFGTDPLCQRHDAGVTATEIVQNLINDYNSSVATLNYRYDDLNIPNSDRLGWYRYNRFFVPMKAFHDKFRQILAQTVAPNRLYLEDLTHKQVEDLIKQAAQDPAKRAEIIDLRDATELGFQFLKKIAMLTDRYCVTQNDQGKNDLVGFDEVRSQIFFAKGQIVKSCMDPMVASAIDSTGKTKVVGEDGFFFKDVRFDMSPENITKSYDIAGMERDRFWATFTLTMRDITSAELMVMGFRPSMMDLPKLRDSWLNAIEPRLLLGVDTSAIKNKMSSQGTALPGMAEKALKYKTEQNFLMMQTLFTVGGMAVPGNSEVTTRRTARFFGQEIPGHQIQNYVANGGDTNNIFPLGNSYFATDAEAEFSAGLIQQAKNVVNASRVTPVAAESMKPVMDELAKVLPSKDEIQIRNTNDFMADMETVLKICQGYLPKAAPAQEEEAEKEEQKQGEEAKAPAEGTQNAEAEKPASTLAPELAEAKEALTAATQQLQQATMMLMMLAQGGAEQEQEQAPDLKLSREQVMACVQMFQPELIVASKVQQALMSIPKTDPEARKKQGAILLNSDRATHKEVGVKYNWNRESLDKRLAAVIEQQTQAQNSYQKNKPEYDAKLNLLKSIMSFLAR